MDFLPNAPLNEEGPRENVFARPVEASRSELGVHGEGAAGSAPHLGVGNTNLQEIPIAELKLLASTHGMSADAPAVKQASHVRVYIFLAALMGIGAFVAWQHYGSTETLNAAIVSSLPSARPVSKDVASASSEPVSSDSSAQDVAESENHKIITTPLARSPSEAKVLDTIMKELAIMRQGLQQVAANQEELARNIASLQATRENTKQKLPASNLSRGTPSQQRKVSSATPLRAGVPSPPPPAPSLNPAVLDNRANIPRPPSSMPEN